MTKVKLQLTNGKSGTERQTTAKIAALMTMKSHHLSTFCYFTSTCMFNEKFKLPEMLAINNHHSNSSFYSFKSFTSFTLILKS